jgi:hypothetical protein
LRDAGWFGCIAVVLVQNFERSGVALKLQSHNLAGSARAFFELELAMFAGRFGSRTETVTHQYKK